MTFEVESRINTHTAPSLLAKSSGTPGGRLVEPISLLLPSAQ
jgi:hypothetical protein